MFPFLHLLFSLSSLFVCNYWGIVWIWKMWRGEPVNTVVSRQMIKVNLLASSHLNREGLAVAWTEPAPCESGTWAVRPPRCGRCRCAAGCRKAWSWPPSPAARQSRQCCTWIRQGWFPGSCPRHHQAANKQIVKRTTRSTSAIFHLVATPPKTWKWNFVMDPNSKLLFWEYKFAEISMLAFAEKKILQ